jgi:cytochrome c biogenesis protein CcdA
MGKFWLNFQNFKVLAGLLLILFSAWLVFPKTTSAAEKEAIIYFSQACSGCPQYVAELSQELQSQGFTVSSKDYINDLTARKELTDLNERHTIPLDLQGHMETFVSIQGQDKLFLQGHVPIQIVKDLLGEEAVNRYEKLLVFQDEMHGEIKSYKVWGFGGEIRGYSITEPVSRYLDWYQENKGTWSEVKTTGSDFFSLLPVVLTSGFLDGLNPCAFAILLFLIAFIFMLHKSRLSVFKFAGVYIGAIYFTYLMIGLGLFKALLIIDSPHLMAKIGAYLVIVLGLINIKDYFFPKLPLSLRIPMPGRQAALDLMHKGTLPATLLLGILVGLCTFPCSGGIYVAIIGLLASQTTQLTGLAHLLIYNLMFILPLVMILALAGNRVVTEKLTNLQEKNSAKMRLIYGVIMILIGVSILVWFI